jgi:hypothetical protein
LADGRVLLFPRHPGATPQALRGQNGPQNLFWSRCLGHWSAPRQSAQRLAGELAPAAMRGQPCSPGEDAMAVSCQLTHPGLELLERVPDAVRDGARAWLIGTDPA